MTLRLTEAEQEASKARADAEGIRRFLTSVCSDRRWRGPARAPSVRMRTRPEAKAAALLQSVVNDHALVDGNERLGWLSTAVFLQINGIEISTAGNDAIYELVIEVAADRPSVDEIARRLRD